MASSLNRESASLLESLISARIQINRFVDNPLQAFDSDILDICADSLVSNFSTDLILWAIESSFRCEDALVDQKKRVLTIALRMCQMSSEFNRHLETILVDLLKGLTAGASDRTATSRILLVLRHSSMTCLNPVVLVRVDEFIKSHIQSGRQLPGSVRNTEEDIHELTELDAESVRQSSVFSGVPTESVAGSLDDSEESQNLPSQNVQSKICSLELELERAEFASKLEAVENSYKAEIAKLKKENEALREQIGEPGGVGRPNPTELLLNKLIFFKCLKMSKNIDHVN